MYPLSKFTILTLCYFLVAFVLSIGEVLDHKILILIFKPVLMPILALLYFLSSERKDIMYFTALVFALLSNIFFIFPGADYLLYGVIAFFLYRLLTIFIVFNYTRKFHFLAFVLAILPFLFLFGYLIDMTQSTMDQGFYPAVGNAIIMSVLAGLSLSNYILEDDRKNSWLLISSLLFVFLMFIFIIEKYYLPNGVFRPLSAIVFATAHFTFYKFVVLNESDSQ